MAWLTTEPTAQGTFKRLRIIHATAKGDAGGGGTFNPKNQAAQADQVVDQAINKLVLLADSLGADGVIGVQHSSTVMGGDFFVTCIGTAIKL